MTVTLWPAPGIHFAALHEDIVVLDVQADRYSCLPAASDWLRLEQDGSIAINDSDAAAELVEAGLAVEERPQPSGRRPPSALREDNRDGAARRLPSLSILFELFGVRQAFGNRSFADLVQTSLPRNRATPDEVETVMLAYAAAAPWCPGEGECLQRTFELRYLLARRGIDATWVFGVRTWPFAAHCWLQVDDMVVGDTLARVQRYTPILAV